MPTQSRGHGTQRSMFIFNAIFNSQAFQRFDFRLFEFGHSRTFERGPLAALSSHSGIRVNSDFKTFGAVLARRNRETSGIPAEVLRLELRVSLKSCDFSYKSGEAPLRAMDRPAQPAEAGILQRALPRLWPPVPNACSPATSDLTSLDGPNALGRSWRFLRGESAAPADRSLVREPLLGCP